MDEMAEPEVRSVFVWDKPLAAAELEQVYRAMVETETWEEALESLHEQSIYPRFAIKPYSGPVLE